MSDQIPSTSTDSAPNTPNSSNQKGKTQVFILSPDILKKLGIASKISNLTPDKLNSIAQSTVQNKKSENLSKSKNILLNKNISNNKKKPCDQKNTIKNAENQFSVKSKLVSMLTSKLEKEKVIPTSDSLENKSDEQTNTEKQIKPKNVINVTNTKKIRKAKKEIKQKPVSHDHGVITISNQSDKIEETELTNISTEPVIDKQDATINNLVEPSFSTHKQLNSSNEINTIKNNTVFSEEIDVSDISKKEEILQTESVESSSYSSTNIAAINNEVTEKKLISSNLTQSVCSDSETNEEIINNFSNETCEDENNTVATYKNSQIEETEENKSEPSKDKQIKEINSSNSEKCVTSDKEYNITEENNVICDIINDKSSNTITSKENTKVKETDSSPISVKCTTTAEEYNNIAENNSSCDSNNDKNDTTDVKENPLSSKTNKCISNEIKLDVKASLHDRNITLSNENEYNTTEEKNVLRDKNYIEKYTSISNKNLQIEEIKTNKNIEISNEKSEIKDSDTTSSSLHSTITNENDNTTEEKKVLCNTSYDEPLKPVDKTESIESSNNLSTNNSPTKKQIDEKDSSITGSLKNTTEIKNNTSSNNKISEENLQIENTTVKKLEKRTVDKNITKPCISSTNITVPDKIDTSVMSSCSSISELKGNKTKASNSFSEINKIDINKKDAIIKTENAKPDEQKKDFIITKLEESTLKNISTNESADKNNSLEKIINLNTIEAEQDILKLETNILENKKQENQELKGRKRKITEESSVEDLESASFVRKSVRKRKLSTLHSDYITELKLHDGSNTAATNRRKSSETKLGENNIENENDKIVLISQKVSYRARKSSEMKLLQNSNQNEKCTMNTNNNAIDANSKDNCLSNTKIDEDKIVNSELCKEENNEKTLLGNQNKNDSVEKDKNILKEDVIDNNDKCEKSNKKQIQDTKPTKRNLNVNVAVKTSPKIIIHENILIKSPTQENFTVLIPKRNYSKTPERKLSVESKKHFELDGTKTDTCSLNNFDTIMPKDEINKNTQNTSIMETDTSNQECIENIHSLVKSNKNTEKENVTLSKKLNENDIGNTGIDSQSKTTTNVNNNDTPDSNTVLITPARRGRPRKTAIVKNETESPNLDTSKNEELNAPTSTPTPRRRGRPSKKDKTVETVETSQDTSEKNETCNTDSSFCETPRRRGRKRKIDILEENESFELDKAKTVTCAICLQEMKNPLWAAHTIKHNFLCWRVGDKPIDLNDRKLLEYILYKSSKNNNRFKTFVCTECGDRKKSVLGFLAHRDICKLSEEERLNLMITCKICSRKMMPQSLKFHMNSHEQETVKKQNLPEISEEGRRKRKAATKAANLIQEVSSNENKLTFTSDGTETVHNRKMYKKIGEPGSIFINFGSIKKCLTLFKNGETKCKFQTCNFKSNNFDKLKAHMNLCPSLNPEHFLCKFCQVVEENENTMIEHVQKHEKKSKANNFQSDSENESNESFNETSDEEETNIKSKKTSKPTIEYAKLTCKISFLANERRAIPNQVTSYLPALKWTENFRNQVYCDILFENIKCLESDWILTQKNEYKKYLPSYQKSMSVKTCSLAYTIPNLQQKEHEWKEYDIYETDITNDTANIFCGGPVSAMAWVPTPLNRKDCDQILAVSTQKDFEATYKISESAYGNEMIQFWNFGPLDCSKPNEKLPSLEFSIVHNHGMVWCMEWCSSGYYDLENPQDSGKLKKLGLLALACSDGNIPIYAIGIPKKNENIKNNMYKVKPQYKLILQDASEKLLGRWKYQVTKISWSKGKNHNIIAGGYSNGVVCLWDLTNTSPLLQCEKNGVKILKPYHTILAHTSAVSALVLYPFIDDGKRWLLTGSWDRSFKYWDINNTSFPISSFGKRGNVTDGVWITHWLCSYFAFDDVFSLGHTVTTVQNPREFGYKQCSALASNSVVMGLSANDWASACAQGTLAGELIATFPRMILISYDVDKHLKCKRMMFSYNELIDKSKHISERKDIMKLEKKRENVNENEKDDTAFSKYIENNSEPYVEEPTTYDKAKEKYGLLFCDFKLNNFNMLPPESLTMVRQSSRLREVPTELYPFTSLNKIAWNPNKQAYLYIACGYQNGFVRLRCVRFMNTMKNKS